MSLAASDSLSADLPGRDTERRRRKIERHWCLVSAWRVLQTGDTTCLAGPSREALSKGASCLIGLAADKLLNDLSKRGRELTAVMALGLVDDAQDVDVTIVGGMRPAVPRDQRSTSADEAS